MTKAPQPVANELTMSERPVTEIAYQGERLFLLAGPCVLESLELTRRIAGGDIARGATIDGEELMQADLLYQIELEELEASETRRNSATSREFL